MKRKAQGFGAGAAALSVIALWLLPVTPSHAQGVLKVMTQGLGSGTVQATMGGNINCGSVCDQTFPTADMVRLVASAGPNSAFDKWLGDCVGTVGATCDVTMSGNRSVRAQFRMNPDVLPIMGDLTPGNIQAYLNANPGVTTSAQFLRALPEEFRKGWILMTRSESLQTGTAKFPRILLPSADARYVFTIGLSIHDSYPGSHPDAIEFMQWDPVEKNFRFHEIVVNQINDMGRVGQFPLRPRGVRFDEPRCTRCHSTRNIPNPNPAHKGTTGTPPGLVKAKNKPNWDTYDSWGGMLPFNRDKVFQGSVEAAALRKLLNPWTWRTDVSSRRVMEQLALQSNAAGELPVYPPEDVFRRIEGGTNDGHIQFAFDGAAIVTSEPVPVGSTVGPVTYSFDSPMPLPGSNIQRDTSIPVILHAFASPFSGEGRGVQLYDQISGGDGNYDYNQLRVGNELANHRFATGSVPLDARPLALAINNNCISADSAGNIGSFNGAPPFTGNLAFFTARHGGMDLAAIIADTSARTRDLPRRKADIEKLNLDRSGDNYLLNSSMTPDIDLLAEYGPYTDFGTTAGIERLRQEVFRRDTAGFQGDTSIMGGNFYVDREMYNYNTNRVALQRYLLEPLGVSVDKWSIAVRGRSRSYAFADVYDTYQGPVGYELQTSLTSDPYPGMTGFTCSDIVTAANDSLLALPGAGDMPTYTDVQRIFNKSCIECHGGLDYPPFAKYSSDPRLFDLSERENPPDNNRLTGSHTTLLDRALVGMNSGTSSLYARITHPSDDCPNGAMPCGGPRLSQADVDTIRRWLDGGHPSTDGDPHIVTVNNIAYDFQSAGEFTLLRGEGIEIQTRQSPVETDGPLPPNGHTGLTSCASLNTAVAMRVGSHRVTYQPDSSGVPNPQGLQIRIDGKPVAYPGPRGIVLSEGGRILPITATGGVQVQYPGGTEVIVTPGFWTHYQVWYLNIEVRAARATFGVMGSIAPRNWLPALPNGAFLGPRPVDLAKRYEQLYVKFADEWRVTEQTTLFDYASGVGTSKYTLRGWPGFEPVQCKLPREWSTGVPAPKKLPASDAKKACANLVGAHRRQNCERDVMLTGDFKFANTYLAAEKFELNSRPNPVELGKPAAFATHLGETVDFHWKRARDRDDGRLTYRHCLWPQDEKFTLKHCKDLGNDSESTAVSGLAAGKFYYWRVVVDDGQGATVDSETRRFQVGESK